MPNERSIEQGRRRFLGAAGRLAALLGGTDAHAFGQAASSSVAAQAGGRRKLGRLDASGVGLGVRNMSRTYPSRSACDVRRGGSAEELRGIAVTIGSHAAWESERRAAMVMLTATVTAIAVLAAASAHAQTLVISRSGSRPVGPAPARNFTGSVQVEMLFEAVDPSRASGGSVTFEPGARTAWHSHPGGQILIITAGTGRVQRWSDPIEEVRAGDVVRIPAGQKHWHGASPHASMTHIAITEHRDGTAVQWMEHVSDEQYNGVISQAPAQGQVQSAQQPSPSNRPQGAARPSGEVQQRIAPGLATLTDEVLFGDVWRRPELSPRDRSLVTISVLIATGKPAQLAGHLGRALDNGVLPSEASGLLAHLAVYCG